MKPFSEGKAAAKMGGKWGFIDLAGQPLSAETALLFLPAETAAAEPFASLTIAPTAEPTPEPTPVPTAEPTAEPTVAPASTVRATGQVNIRTQPNRSASILTSVKKGARLTYCGVTSTDERGIQWYCIEVNGQQGWISSKYSELEGSGASRPSGSNSASQRTVRLTGDVNLRDEPSLSGKTLDSIASGTTLTYLNKSSVDERGVTWYKVAYRGTEGWVSSKYSHLK